VPSTTIGVCARYIHSHQTLYAMDDFLQAQAFLQALVKKLDRSTVDLIKNY
jgi:Cellulase M and related proteins